MKISAARLLIGTVLALLVALPATEPLRGFLSFQDENTNIRINLGIVSAIIGTDASVPLSISFGSETQVGQLRGEVRFPPKWLTFQGIASTERLKSAQGQVEAELQTGAQVDTAIVTFSISVPDGLSLPPDTLAEVIFSVAEDADVTEMFILDMEAEALTSGNPPKTIEDLTIYSGGITAAPPPNIFGCFFYMH